MGAGGASYIAALLGYIAALLIVALLIAALLIVARAITSSCIIEG